MINFKRCSAAALLGLVVALCAPAVQAQNPQKVKIRTEWIPNGIYGGLYYGQQRGVYAKEGLSVEVLPGNGSFATMDGLARGDIDFGFVTCWSTAVGISKGRPVISVGTYTGKIGFAFYTAKDSGVRSLKDLAGKTIVVSPAGFDTQIFPAVLASNGLPPDLMKPLNVDPAQKIPTYTRGQADVVVSTYPYADPLIQEQRPSNVMLWSASGFTMPDYCIVTSKEKLEKDPQLVARFLRATYAASAEAAGKPQEAADAALELNPLLNRNTTRRQWQLMSEMFYTDETRGCPHGWHSSKDWAKALETLQKYGGLEGSIADQSKFYTNRFFPCSKS